MGKLKKEELLKWLKEWKDSYTDLDDRAMGYENAIEVIESGDFDDLDDWELRYEVAFANGQKYLKEIADLKDTLNDLSETINIPNNSKYRHSFRRIEDCLKHIQNLSDEIVKKQVSVSNLKWTFDKIYEISTSARQYIPELGEYPGQFSDMELKKAREICNGYGYPDRKLIMKMIDTIEMIRGDTRL